METLTKITLAYELFLEGIPKLHIAHRLDIGRATVYRWLTGIHQRGELALFLEAYQQAKKGPRSKRKLNPLIKRYIWQLRHDHRDCCGQKIQYHLKREYDIDLGVKTIYQVLAEKYVLKSRWKKNKARGPVPKADKPRQVVQMDSVDFGAIFAFTGIDIFTKDADVLLRPTLTGRDGKIFLDTAMNRTFDSHTDLLQADGGSEFKAEFKAQVHHYCDRYRVARPYKKNEQSYIESFNRSLRKECLGWGQYTPKDIPQLTREVQAYLVYYHYTRPHLGLDMQTPHQFKTNLLSHI